MNNHSHHTSLIKKLLRIDQEGVVCVIEFKRCPLPAMIDDQVLCRELTSVLKASQCESVRFVLTGQNYLPSCWLGLLALPIRLGLSVSVVNPSAHVRESLHSTRLERLMVIEPSGT